MNHPVAHWSRRLEASAQPAYLLIADLIAEDVRNGRLSARDRLPTLRELADLLRLNYTTVARAYAEARKRGLIDSRPGMGTFVRGTSPSLPLRGGSGAEMTMNMPPEPADAALLARMHDSAADVLARTDLYDLMRYQDFGGAPDDRRAAVQWLRRGSRAARGAATAPRRGGRRGHRRSPGSASGRRGRCATARRGLRGGARPSPGAPSTPRGWPAPSPRPCRRAPSGS